jgi:hypothetical protein
VCGEEGRGSQNVDLLQTPRASFSNLETLTLSALPSQVVTVKISALLIMLRSSPCFVELTIDVYTVYDLLPSVASIPMITGTPTSLRRLDLGSREPSCRSCILRHITLPALTAIVIPSLGYEPKGLISFLTRSAAHWSH